MKIAISIEPSQSLIIRDPQKTDLGRRIIQHGLILMDQLGYEQFTFRKLAEEIGTAEAGIYRYFENKHRLLLYYLTWYWNVFDYIVMMSINNLEFPQQKIDAIIDVLSNETNYLNQNDLIDHQALHRLVINESSKTYLVKDVDNINNKNLFKPYKDLVGRMATVFTEYAPAYPYPHSLASSIIEISHMQVYFRDHLPRLTNLSENKARFQLSAFLKTLIYPVLDNYTSPNS